MNAVRVWLRLDLRRRWRSLTVLALLIAVATGTVLAAAAGARRGDSALERLQARTLPATAVVLPNQPGFDWDRVRAMPEVETLTTFLLGQQFPFAGLSDDISTGFPPGDPEFMRSIERPIVLQGRIADPTRADEAVVSPYFVKYQHKGVGDTVTALLYSPEQLRGAGPEGVQGAPNGPKVRIRIVGVVRSPWLSDEVGGRGGLQVSAGLTSRYRANFYDDHSPTSYTNAMLRLHGGERALPAFEQHLKEVTGRSDIDVWNMAAQARQKQRSLSFQARCLLAFAAAALIAALFLVGQAVARYTSASIAELQVLRALGMAPVQAVQAAAAGPFLAALVGATGGVALAGLASSWFPFGSAALVEPTPGADFDWLVLGAGWVAVSLVVLAGASASAWLALGAGRRHPSARASAVAAAVARSGLPVPVVVGTRFALETGRGRTAVPVRPALLAAIVGVLGVLGAFTFSSGVSEAAGNPARFGETWQLTAWSGLNQDFTPDPPRSFTAAAADRDVTGVDDARIAVAHAGSNGTAVSLWSHDPVRKPIPVVLTAGRLPASATEVALAPGSAEAIRAGLGSRIAFAGEKGQRTLTVVGIGFVPAGPHNDYNTGGWVTRAGYEGLFDKVKFHLGLITVRPGVDPKVVMARLQKTAADAGIGPNPFPPPVAELRQVRILPIVLGGFLVLLAFGAVGHALATAVRRRRLDVAVLRALGMTRWQSRGVVVTQATVLAGVGLIFGIPLGLALGRTLWRVVADYTPLQYAPPLALLALLLVGPLALVVANLLAAWPGHQAARLRISHVLRVE
jgi:hypothetical protein